MKKLTLLSVLLLVLGLTMGFAEDVLKPATTIAGSATMTWGIDLDTGDTGFYNVLDAAITLQFISKQTLTKGAEAPVYGEFKFTDLEVKNVWDETAGADGAGTLTTTATFGTVSAKIIAKPIWIQVYQAPSISDDAVAAIEANTDATILVLNDESGADVATTYATYGTAIGFDSGMFSVAAKVKTLTDWTTATADNAYSFGVDGTLTVTPLTLTFGGSMGVNYAANPIGFYVKPSVALPFDPMKLTAYAAFDGQSTGTTLAWEAGGGLTFYLNSTKDSAGAITYGSNIDVAAVYGAAFNGVDVKAVFTEPATAGFVDNLGFGLTAYILDIGATAPMTMEYKIEATGSYKVALQGTNYLTPSFTVKYGNDYETAHTSLGVTVAAEAVLIPNTKFTAQWASTDLLTTPPDGGIFTFATKISY